MCSVSYACGVPSTCSWYRVARANACCWYVRISDSTSNARSSANARRATAELVEIEVERDLAAPAQMHAAGDVEEPGELGEPVAVRIRRDLRELVAQILRE